MILIILIHGWLTRHGYFSHKPATLVDDCVVPVFICIVVLSEFVNILVAKGRKFIFSLR